MLYPDISHHHVVKSWADVQANVGFLITKATEGTSYIDPTLNDFIKQCEARKIPYWLYTFLRKGDELAQTKFMVGVCKTKVGKYFCGYILDVESNNSEANVISALDWLKKQGGKCMLYTMYAQYGKYKTAITTRGKNVAWWEARYGLNNGKYNRLFPCHKGVDLHQFTSKGVCPGIPDKIDLSRLTGTLKESWFITKETKAEKIGYPFSFPVLPGRGYYKVGDGYLELTNTTEDIRRIQMLANWIAGTALVIDGKYGEQTKAAVKKLQKIVGAKEDGLFGKETLEKAKAYKK